MTVMQWKNDNKIEELFVGICDQPVAIIFRSNKGSHWRAHIKLPLKHNLWRRWVPQPDLKEMVEKLVDEWITFATMDPPTKDDPE